MRDYRNLVAVVLLLCLQLGCSRDRREAIEQLGNMERLSAIYRAIESFRSTEDRMPRVLQELVDAQLLNPGDIEYRSASSPGSQFLYYADHELDKGSKRVLLAAPYSTPGAGDKGKLYRIICRHNGFRVSLEEARFQDLLINGPTDDGDQILIDGTALQREPQVE